MTLSRRTLLLGIACSGASACTSTTSRSRTDLAPTLAERPAVVEAHEPAVREALIARYSGERPVVWGEDVPGVVRRLSTTDRVVAVTLDACGGRAGSGYDAALIETLRRRRVPATLFVNARWIEANPQEFRRLAADPLFEIANHGTEHRPLSVTGRSVYGITGTADVAQVVDEVSVNQRLVTELTGVAPAFFRSGTAYYDDLAVRIVTDLGLQVVNFDVLADAGATYSAARVARAMTGSRPGSIMLGHMNAPGSGTAEGAALALPELRRRGFRFVRLSEYLHRGGGNEIVSRPG